MTESLKPRLRPAELARRHGLSAQAVRNYEGDGFLPVAERTPTGYRIYTRTHELALAAYVALIGAHGHAAAGRSCARSTTTTSTRHCGRSTRATPGCSGTGRPWTRSAPPSTRSPKRPEIAPSPPGRTADPPGAPEAPYSIGALAHRLDVTAATLRAWERAGILRPRRDVDTGHRSYDADDVRDADLARLLRRGGERLNRIAVVVGQVRDAGSIDAVAASLAEWQARITRRGLAMIEADRHLADYLALLRRAVETDTESRH